MQSMTECEKFHASENTVIIGLLCIFTYRQQCLCSVMMKGSAVRVGNGQDESSLSLRDVMTVSARQSHTLNVQK